VLVFEKGNGMGTVLMDFIITGMTALIFIVVGKLATAKYPVPGLSQLFGAA
jgi:hypothetical protein